MLANPAYEKEIIRIILFTSVFFIVVSVVLVLFFYFSRKKIIQKELEKSDLIIQYQKEQLRAVIITQEEERKRIAQDLHDDISSKLNVVSLNSHLLKASNLTKNEIEDITGNIISLTGKALESTRRIAHDLLPPVFDKFGLHAGVEELCLEFNSSKSVQVEYHNAVVFDDLEKDKHLHVFRVLQELMNNSLRHGKASKIVIAFEKKESKKVCRYFDNGIGFDLKDKRNQNGLGMNNIKSRIDFLGGEIFFSSQINNGTQVTFNF